MKKNIVILLFALFLSVVHKSALAQFYGVKINTLAVASGTVNAGFEMSLCHHCSLDLSAYWNPVRTNRVSLKAAALQPGVRYWFYESFAGHFIGTHLTAANYDIGNSRYAYSGWLTGIGGSYGYAWLLNQRWNLTVEAGIGLYFMRDSKRFHDTPPLDDRYTYHYKRVVFGPSKCELSFTYLF